MTSIPTTARPQPPAAPEEPMASIAPCDAAADTRPLLRSLVRRLAGDRGAATAEYAVATMAAVGFAGLLVVILRGDEVRGILTDLVRNALTVG
jgi:hypothetical protein